MGKRVMEMQMRGEMNDQKDGWVGEWMARERLVGEIGQQRDGRIRD